MSILLASWIFLLSLALGATLLRRFGFEFKTRMEEVGFGFALGYGLIGYLTLILGLLGLLFGWLFLLVFGLMTLVLAREEIEWLKRLRSSLTGLSGLRVKDPIAFYLVVFSLGVLLLGLFQSFLPPTAHDALCYHLYIPKRFVETHKIVYLPYLVNSLFPFLIQMHYTLALLFGRAELANIFHWFTGIGTFLGVISLSRRFGNLTQSLLAGILFVLTPGIFNQMVIAYNDIALTFFTFFAVYAFLISRREKDDLKWFILMGIFSGFSLSVKYLGMLHMVAIVLILTSLVMFKKVKAGRIIPLLVCYFGFTFLFSFAWYLRSFYYEGNPVYPFFPSFFGGVGHEYNLAKAGFGKGPADLALVWWRLTVFPQHFGGTWAQLGAGFLALIPTIILLNWKRSEIRLIGSFLGIFFLSWFFLAQNLRFLFPAIPFLSILIALGSEPFLFWLGLIVTLNTGFAVYHGKEGYPYLLGRISREIYLERNERSYSLSLWINQNLPRDAKVLNMEEVRMFYFGPEMIRESEYRKKRKYESVSRNEEDIVFLLKQDGITHILVTQTGLEKKDLLPNSLRLLVRSEKFRRRYLKLLYSQNAKEGDEKLSYSVYQIN